MVNSTNIDNKRNGKQKEDKTIQHTAARKWKKKNENKLFIRKLLYRCHLIWMNTLFPLIKKIRLINLKITL